MSKEIFRMIIPGNKVINDNSNNNYRAHMGKLKYLTSKTEQMLDGDLCGPGNFIVPPKEEIQKYIKNGKYSLTLEVWKCQQRFDLLNYSMTFKPIIDVFSAREYWEDDNWKYFIKPIFNGGDYSVWKERAIRYEGDNLPDEITREWWESEMADPRKDLFVRLIINEI